MSEEKRELMLQLACLKIALVLGRAKIFGFKPKKRVKKLTPKRALRALKAIKSVILSGYVFLRWEFFNSLKETSPEEREEAVCGIVEFLNFVLCACEGIYQAYEQMLQTPPVEFSLQEFEKELDSLGECRDALDGLLRMPAYKQLLAGIAHTSYLAAQKAKLQGDWRDLPPWWLDGTLEEWAQQLWEARCVMAPPSEN